MGVVLAPRGITKAHLTRAGIGEDYWAADFYNYKGPAKASKAAYDYLDRLVFHKQHGVGLLLAGDYGVGKTTLMAIVLKYLARSNWSVMMSSLSELVETVKRSWDDKALVDDIDHYKHVDFLGLDDLGKEHAGPTGFSAVTFDNILRYRVQHCLPTLFTTNLTRNLIEQRYGEAVLSLIEGKTKVVLVVGDDYRSEVQKHALR